MNSPRSLIASLNRGVTTLKHGLPLVLFPEGGRAATGQLQTMMSGCAYMAIKAQVPLVPLTLIGTYELLPIHVYALHPRPLLVVVGDPISTDGLTTRDADALTQRLYESISATYAAVWESGVEAGSTATPQRCTINQIGIRRTEPATEVFYSLFPTPDSLPFRSPYEPQSCTRPTLICAAILCALLLICRSRIPHRHKLPPRTTPVGHWVAEHLSNSGIGSWWDFRPDGTLTMHVGAIVTSPITRSGDTFTSPP